MSVAVSFRDPGGSCFASRDRVFRFVRGESISYLQRFLDSPSARGFIADHLLIPTRALDCSEAEDVLGSVELSMAEGGVVYEHERVFFPSYPFEWPPEMLAAAGKLTVDLARRVLLDDFILKDASPHNVLFRGPDPVFVDVLSFEPRDPADPVWRPYAQFVRTFLLPLLAHKQWRLSPAEIFLTHRDGVEPEELYQRCGVLRRLLPPFLNLVSAPVWMSGKSRNPAFYARRPAMAPDKAAFILEVLFRRLDRSLRQLQPKLSRSTWVRYMEENSYTEKTFRSKERFVDDALSLFAPKRVLDVGANTGHFSLLAARKGAAVVAIDSDAVCMGKLWRKAKEEQLDVLPLIVDFSRPTPAVGWRNAECPSFLERATQSFDCVLMLAVLHHLLITERIPLEEVLKLGAQLTSKLLIIEYVDPADEMFVRLSRGRAELFNYLTPHFFETAASKYFTILNSSGVPDSRRRLYVLQQRCDRSPWSHVASDALAQL